MMRTRSRSLEGRHDDGASGVHDRSRLPMPRRFVRAYNRYAYRKWREDDHRLQMDTYKSSTQSGILGASRNARNSMKMADHRYLPMTYNMHPSGNQPLDMDETTSSGHEWNEMMTFRTFVIMRTPEESEAAESYKAYDQYKETFLIERVPKFLRRLKGFPVIQERYNSDFLQKEFERCTNMAKRGAAQFLKLFAEDHFVGVSLVEQNEDYRGIDDTAFSQRIPYPSAQSGEQPVPLSPPLWMPNDPNLNCLYIRKISAQLSKWDLLEFVESRFSPENVLDVTLTEPEDFFLTLQGGHPKRSAWIQFDSDETCSSAEIFLERAALKNCVLHPLRRIPNLVKSTLCLTPSEACHPTRILRDLTLSARLILKLDHDYDIVKEYEGRTTPSDSFEVRCLEHPILSEFQQVFNGLSRSPEEQLDLQLLYLRVVHCVCYYAGRRFTSQRHLWNSIGPLYQRPRVDLGELLRRFRDFESPTGDGWDKDYVEALDLLNADAMTTSVTTSDIPQDFHRSFEPKASISTASTRTSLIKQEVQMIDANEENMALHGSDNHSKVIGDKTRVDVGMTQQIDLPVKRGRCSEWLRILDTRIAYLLGEDIKSMTEQITAESPEVKTQWTEFCSKMIDEVAFEKWRCGLCAKMFRGKEFVKKHLGNKHSDYLNDIINELQENQIIQRYMADPYHPDLAPPVVMPYLYRRGLPNYLQYEISSLPPSTTTIPGKDTTNGVNIISKQITSSQMPQYRDLDAPRPVKETSEREIINYDDI